MIKIKEKKNKKKVTPHYKLVFNYMIGDADGDTTEEVDNILLDDPNIEKLVTCLRKLKPLKGTWGVQLDFNDLAKHFEEKQINKEEYEFLRKLLFTDEDDFIDDEDEFSIFTDAVRSETEYSFLVFQGVDLYYIDENGTKHETELVK